MCSPSPGHPKSELPSLALLRQIINLYANDNCGNDDDDDDDDDDYV